MPQPTDINLYEKVKANISSKYKHSAYRSGLIVKQYKKEYYEKHKNNNAYTGSREKSNLKRWFQEAWTNQKGKVGYQNKDDVYRPTKRINSKTPTTFNELTQKQVKKAQAEKKTKKRVKIFSTL